MDAVIIVDLQRAFAPPPDLVERIKARAAGFPRRVFTRFVNPPGSLLRRKLDRRSCAPGSAEAGLVLAPSAGDLVLDKPGYGLTGDAVRRLRADGVRHALVCGGDTDACLLGVVFSLFDGGIDCTVEPSLCWSASGLHDCALRILNEQFGTPADLGLAPRPSP